MRVLLAVALVVATLAQSRAVVALTCTDQVGPGIPPPTSLPPKLPGFHAAWYGQSGYMRLCPGDTATATLAYYNSGSLGWVGGRLGEAAYLGTWASEPGQDQPSILGGDGAEGGGPDAGSATREEGTPAHGRTRVLSRTTMGRLVAAHVASLPQVSLYSGTILDFAGSRVKTAPGGHQEARAQCAIMRS